MASGCFYPRCTVIEVEGKDAQRYLHARLSNDVASLKQGQSVIAAALNHQGKPQGLFQVCAVTEGSYLLISEGEKNEDTLTSLLQFKVADRVNASFRDDLKVLHTQDLPQKLPESALTTKRHRLITAGYDIITDSDALFIEGMELIDEEEVYKQRVLSGHPIFPDEIEPQKILLESGAPEAVSFRKGCYIGQEVLEKIDSHGKAPSQIVSMSCRNQIEASQKIKGTDTAISGTIVSCSWNVEDQLTYGFARIRSTDSLPSELHLESGDTITFLQNRLTSSMNFS